VAAILLAAAPAAALAAPSAPLSQRGRWVTDARGRVVVLHGVNMVYKRPPYAPSAAGFDAPDARFLRRAGFDTVRLGVIYKAVEPSPGHYDDAYLANIAKTVKLLSSQGIFTLLDFHQDLYNERFQGEGFPDWAVMDDGLPAQPQAGFPGNYLVQPATNRAFDHFWNDDGGLQKRYAAAWRHVAQRFSGDTRVLGYDIFNEPWPGTGWQACANTEGCPQFDEQKLGPFERKVTGAIRQSDGRHIVWYEPNVIFNNGSKTFVPSPGPQTGMSFHVYCLTDQNTSDPADPGETLACDPQEELPFANADDHARQTGNALLLTEFGATDDLGQVERVVDRADVHMVGWQYWHYCECDDPTTSGNGGTQSLVADAKRPPSGSNVKTDKLAVLERPYPQAIAGTPKSFGYDPSSHRFTLDYTTARLAGGRFAFRADTQVHVPKLAYPKGYDVTVKGGEAISLSNASALHVRTCRGRKEVSVVVTRGSGKVRGDCAAAREIKLTVRPGRVRAGRLTRFRFRATVIRGGKRRAVSGARIRFAGHSARTNRRGRAALKLRLGRAGKRRARARHSGLVSGAASVRVRRR
jgi:endoglycosylceramidase